MTQSSRDDKHGEGSAVDEEKRWLEIRALSGAVARKDGAPTEVESALCGAVWRAAMWFEKAARLERELAETVDMYQRALKTLAPSSTASASGGRYVWMPERKEEDEAGSFGGGWNSCLEAMHRDPGSLKKGAGGTLYVKGWNACRQAMIEHNLSSPNDISRSHQEKADG